MLKVREQKSCCESLVISLAMAKGVMKYGFIRRVAALHCAVMMEMISRRIKRHGFDDRSLAK